MRIIETTTPLDDDPSLKIETLAMIEGVANGSCELQIIEARRNTKPWCKCSQCGYNLQKQACRGGGVKMLQVC